jgi:hypothetical protein
LPETLNKIRNIKSNNFNIQIFVFCLIIIQSIGIRFFQGQGTFLSSIIILLCFRNFKLLLMEDIRFLLSSFFLILLCRLSNDTFYFLTLSDNLSAISYQLLLIFSAYIFLVGYRYKAFRLQNDFFYVLQIFVFHAIIGYLLFFLLPIQFINYNEMNKSFYYLFFVSNSTFGNIQRNTGVFWEPGLFQLIANFYLFFCIKLNKGIVKIFIAVLAVISSMSTTGLFILLINLVYYIYTKSKEKKIKIFNLIIIIIFKSFMKLNFINLFVLMQILL